MKAHIIQADGNEFFAECDGMAAIAKVIEAQNGVDVVNLRDGRVMICDDLAWETEFVNHGNGRFELRPIRPLRPINARATALYHSVCLPGTTHQIAGDVAIVHDSEFE